jgi:hypothetical protein
MSSYEMPIRVIGCLVPDFSVQRSGLISEVENEPITASRKAGDQIPNDVTP